MNRDITVAISGIVTEAVTRHTGAKILGLCSGIPLIIEEIKKDFGGEFPDLHAYCREGGFALPDEPTAREICENRRHTY